MLGPCAHTLAGRTQEADHVDWFMGCWLFARNGGWSKHLLYFPALSHLWPHLMGSIHAVDMVMLKGCPWPVRACRVWADGVHHKQCRRVGEWQRAPSTVQKHSSPGRAPTANWLQAFRKPPSQGPHHHFIHDFHGLLGRVIFAPWVTQNALPCF